MYYYQNVVAKFIKCLDIQRSTAPLFFSPLILWNICREKNYIWFAGVQSLCFFFVCYSTTSVGIWEYIPRQARLPCWPARAYHIQSIHIFEFFSISALVFVEIHIINTYTRAGTGTHNINSHRNWEHWLVRLDKIVLGIAWMLPHASKKKII